MYDSLYKYEGQGPTTEPTIVQVSFGYSYVADMRMLLYEGRHQDYCAAVDIYVNDKYLMGITIRDLIFLRNLLTQEEKIRICHFNAGYKDGEKCNHTGRFFVVISDKDHKLNKCYAHITFEFRGHIENDHILCLRKTDVPRLVKAFDKCERELYKLLPLLQTEMNKQ